MDEMSKIPEEQNNEELVEQQNPDAKTEEVIEPVAEIPTPKAQKPKLPFIIGGIVAGVAAIAVTVALVLGGGSNGNDNISGENNVGDSNGVGDTHVHSFGAWNIVDEPACLEAGLEERVCECDEKETRPVAALGHTEVVDSAVDPTCTSTGLTEGKRCSVCDTVITAQDTIPMLSHTYDNKYDEDCNVCGHERDAECGHFETEVIPGKAATCTATGLTDGSKCKKCGETLTSQSVIPVKPHTEIVDQAVSATCTSTGLTEGKHCSVCSSVLVAQSVTNMKPHTEVIDTAVAATCKVTGLTEGKKCSICGTTLVAQQVIPKTDDHNTVIDEAITPTYTTRGKTQGSHCSICNTVLVEQRDIATIWNGEAVEPTSLVKINDKYYYEINSAEELAFLSQPKSKWHEYNYILKCDIILNACTIEYDEEGKLISDPTQLKQWTPIPVFKGIFDGNDHCISGLFCSSSEEGVGLFGSVSYERSNVENLVNLTITNSYVKGVTAGGICAAIGNSVVYNCSFEGMVVGDIVGGIVGKNYSSQCRIFSCVNFGTVVANVKGGGILGDVDNINRINIDNCTNYGDIYTCALSNSACGGIVGSAAYSLSDCINYGTVIGSNYAGGIAGRSGHISSTSHARYSNCTNYGDIYTISETDSYCGGIVGFFDGTFDSNLSDCKNYGAVNGKYAAGGIVGKAIGLEFSGCFNYGKTSGSVYVGGVAGILDKGDYFMSGHDVYYLNSVDSCANFAEIEGVTYVGGIIGKIEWTEISNCNNKGNVIGDENVGAIIGYYDIFFDEHSDLSNCFYLKNNSINSAINGIGNLEDELEGCEAKDDNFFNRD